MKKIVLAAIAAALSLTACLKNDPDYFDQSASERGQVAVEQAIEVLQSAQNGWRMVVYPFPETADYGGFNLFVKFDQKEVTAMGEIFGPDVVSTSYYSVTQENGPMLSFDSYNDVIHFFSDPGYGANEGIGEKQYGLHGDTDFIVMEASPEFIKLKGRITDNYAYMYPLPAGADWTTEMDKYVAIADQMFEIDFYRCLVDGKEVGFYYAPTWNNFTSRWFEFEIGNEVIDVPYTLTQTGVQFYVPVNLGGHTVSEMTLVDGWYLSNADGSVKILQHEPIESQNQIDIEFQSIATQEVVVATYPSTEEYYFTSIVQKAVADRYTDTELIAVILADLNDGVDPTNVAEVFEANADSGAVAYRYSSLAASTNYVAYAFGISISREGDIIVPTTGLFRKEFKTADPSNMDEKYKQWIGTWIATSTSSLVTGSKLQYELEISINNPNATLNVTGMSIQMVREWFPHVVNYNRTTGNITFINSFALGSASGYDFSHIGYIIRDGSMVRVTGSYTPLTGTLTGTNTATFTGANINLSGGGSYTAAGIEIFGTAGGSVYTFGPADGFTSGDYGIGPYTLTKVSSSISSAPTQPVAPATRADAAKDLLLHNISRTKVENDYGLDLLAMHMLCVEEAVAAE